jgi:hypothetical protein
MQYPHRYHSTDLDIPISDLSLTLGYALTLMGSVQWGVRLSIDVMVQVNDVYQSGSLEVVFYR